jgi:4-carboxymuconolactone decarboxylase
MTTPPVPSGETTMIEAGDAMRRRVLGDDHVDRSRNSATDFTRPLQDLITEYCWGVIWNRPGLDLRIRSMINLAMLTALGKMDEFELHVRGAVRNGVTTDEIREVLLQTAIYCGVPAALDATRHAQAILNALDD